MDYIEVEVLEVKLDEWAMKREVEELNVELVWTNARVRRSLKL